MGIYMFFFSSVNAVPRINLVIILHCLQVMSAA